MWTGMVWYTVKYIEIHKFILMGILKNSSVAFEGGTLVNKEKDSSIYFVFCADTISQDNQTLMR